MHSAAAPRSEKLDLRLSARAKRTLQSAAAAANKSVTEFVLDSAIARAEEQLADRRMFMLDEAQWAAFQKALDAPPREIPELTHLLRKPSIFDGSADA